MNVKRKIAVVLGLIVVAATAHGEADYFIEGMVGQSDQENILYGYNTISDRSKMRDVRGGFYFGDTWGLELGRSDFG